MNSNSYLYDLALKFVRGEYFDSYHPYFGTDYINFSIDGNFRYYHEGCFIAMRLPSGKVHFRKYPTSHSELVRRDLIHRALSYQKEFSK